ncbi:pentapeptide repeat-containing protein [Actinoplanes sp. LDG1-06]|uniref:Pentapeptide repeat-containing protein n=1 Tax=Paractinoplanes ovalisporus TaxID=2810368 RepID=A0ABS2A479_9ACTN|nr:pentapeptide repeat-containing protein [Actinoplanes ovalisporus]MBM2614031.1 pentapeptide repeat-containing protein [Actinoplanes ovalisporus]
MARRELIDRWRTGEARSAVLARLAEGGSLPTLDLRGLPAAGLESQNAEFSGADLQWATLAEARIEGVRWEKCRFDGADLADAVLTGGAVTGSTMVRTILRDTLIAGTVWESVDLTGAKMNHFKAERTTFRQCTFPALRKVDFTACVFEECRFTGGLDEVRFLGRGADPAAALRRVTFKSGAFRYAEFDGMEFDQVTFPAGDAVVVVPGRFRAVAQRAGELSDDPAVRRFLSHESLRPGLSESAGWAAGTADLPGATAEVLREAQAQLRAEGVVS